MKYTLDLERMSIQEYKTLLKQQNLLPGRRILWQDIDKKFSVFESREIRTVAQLKKSLSTAAKIADIEATSDISEEYLVILKREIGSLEQKPVPLSGFPDIDPSLVAKLGCAGLKTSKDYWEQFGNVQQREKPSVSGIVISPTKCVDFTGLWDS